MVSAAGAEAVGHCLWRNVMHRPEAEERSTQSRAEDSAGELGLRVRLISTA
jgi:hypothetical protein